MKRDPGNSLIIINKSLSTPLGFGLIFTCRRFQGQPVLQSPAEGAEPDVQVEQPGVPSPVVVGEAGVAEAEPPAHVLEDPDRPVEGRVPEVPELQDRVLQDQVHRTLTPSSRLAGAVRAPLVQSTVDWTSWTSRTSRTSSTVLMSRCS
ncbi:hypothetical protein EYF80_032475 [Liparis tanakae]|uniref:Uncharacterized protein n=1 Tax=Liparis tanakae TaxID=230148 RepID=A0A4Z2GUU2_9TELE|nr:hypothetical protein EYF80_032475 [Liparis tanakae]